MEQLAFYFCELIYLRQQWAFDSHLYEEVLVGFRCTHRLPPEIIGNVNKMDVGCKA